MKTCRKCDEEKSLDEFYNQSSSKDGKMGRCKKCCAKHNKEWQAANPERARERWRIAAQKSHKQRDHRKRAKRYDLSPEELSVLLSETTCCQICGKSFDVVVSHVDHCHETGRVRGLLCANCNTGIGNLRDSVELLERAIEYLRL